MSTPIATAIAHLRGEIEQRVEALRALERLAPADAPPPVLLLTSDKPPPTPLEAAIAAAPPASEPRRGALLKDPAPGRSAPRTGRTAPIDPAQLRELHRRGLNDAAIARELGRSQAGVSHALRKLGLAPNTMPKAAAVPSVERVNAAATIVSWLRKRDTIIVDVEPGKTWKVNGRDVIDRAGLLTMANRKREIAKLPPYAWEFGQ
jgi:hypothetical protein